MKQGVKEIEYLRKLKKWKYKVLSLCLLLVVIGLLNVYYGTNVSAHEESIGDEFILFQNVTLIQNCDCNSVTFSKIINPDGIVILTNEEGVKDGTSFNFTMNGTLNNLIGVYIVTGEGNLTNGEIRTFAYTYEVDKQGGVFGFDITKPINLIVGGLLVLAIIGLFIKGETLFSGGLTAILGIFFGYNGAVWFLSFPIVLVGLAMMGLSERKVKKR